MSQSSQGPPYVSNNAVSGGVPTVTTDIPVCAVFLALYICFAITHTALYETNRRKGRIFFLSRAIFGFCMARVVTMSLRIAWSMRMYNVRLAIAAQIFNNAGILIIYVLNLVLAQRILRARQPKIGWSTVVNLTHKVLYAAIVLSLALVISSTVWSLYTLDSHDRLICRDIQLAIITFLLIYTCLPLLYICACLILPESSGQEYFGVGSFRAKFLILAASTTLCIFISGFKAGTTWSTPRPTTKPAWYDSKASYYIFNFTLEVLILSVLTFGRIDKRFFVPNGCRQPGDYTRLMSDAPWRGKKSNSSSVDG